MRDVPSLKEGEKFSIRAHRTSISSKKLKSLITDLLDGNEEETLGYYKLGKINIDIFYDRTTTERCRDIYIRRRANGLCVACGVKVKNINYRTGRPYRYCDKDRKKYDHVTI